MGRSLRNVYSLPRESHVRNEYSRTTTWRPRAPRNPICSQSDLRIRSRSQESRGILRGIIGILRKILHLHPTGVGAELLPAGEMRRQVRTGRYVAKVREVRSSQRLTEEYRVHPERLHDFHFSFVE